MVFFNIFSNPLSSLASFYKRTLATFLSFHRKSKFLSLWTLQNNNMTNLFSWDLILPGCLNPALTQKSVTDFSVVTGTLALLLTYLLCKEADVARWGILTGCLLFCQLLQFCCYHTGAIMFALGRRIFCIFVHPGWAHTLPTWTAMTQTYQINIWICLVSGMSDSVSLLIRDTKEGMILLANFTENTAFYCAWVLPIWAFVNFKPIFSLS